LLSDEGSHVIRRLGLINEGVLADHAFYGIKPNPRHVDLPYPGVFVLDRAGRVAHKRFHESYRVRDTGAGLLDRVLGIAAPGRGAQARTEGDAVRVRAWLDSPTYAWFQRLNLFVEIEIAEGYHVYGDPAPAGSVPLSVRVDPIEGLEVEAMTWPAPHRCVPDGLTEEALLHEGTIRGVSALTFAGAPGAGDHVIRVTVELQACSDALCFPPARMTLALPIGEVALVDRALPTEAATPR
jgi:DsbC/DsbD-like thiol-disulfide interchange protein